MATEERLVTESRDAGADLSSNQYLFHKLNTSGQVVICNSAGEDAYGILQNEPAAAGRAANIAKSGISKVILGANSLTPGMKIQTNASGKAIEAASADHVLGTLRLGGDTDEVGEIDLNSSHHILA